MRCLRRPLAPPEIRNNFYQQAAWKALNQGGRERARQIVNDNVSDPMQRNHKLTEIDRQELWRTAGQNRWEEVRQLLSRIRADEERASMLVQLATSATGRGDKKTATQLLDDAWEMVGNQAESFSQLGAQLQIARAYGPLNPIRGFEILEPMVDRLNTLSAAAEVLYGYERQWHFKDGEFMLQGGNMVMNIIQQYVVVPSSLAQADFDRARSLANRFQRNEAQILARISIVQGVMARWSAIGD